MVTKKNNKLYDFVIIGTGISGVFCADYLLNKYKDLNLAVVDKGNYLQDKNLENIDQNYKKNFLNHNVVTENNNHSPKFNTTSVSESLIHENYFSNFFRFETIKIGGFGNFWGSVLFPFNKKECVNAGIRTSNFKKEYFQILNFFDITGSSNSEIYPKETSNISFGIFDDEPFNDQITKLNKNFVFGPTLLALDRNKCKLSGACLYGCPNKAIFSPINKLTNLRKRFSRLDLFTSFHVNEIVEKNNLYIIRDFRNKKIRAKKVLICCGSINSHKLLSKICNKNILNSKLHHNPYVTFPVFSISKKYSYKKLPLPKYHFMFKKKFIGTIYNIEKLPKNFLAQNSPIKNTFFLRLLFSKLLSHMYVIVLFFDSSYSDSRIDTFNGKTFVRGNYKKHFYIKSLLNFFALLPKLFKKGMIPLSPFLTKGYIGSDLHYYGSLSSTKIVNIKTGNVKKFKDVYICDGSLLKNIPAKHPVFNSLLKTLQIIQKL